MKTLYNRKYDVKHTKRGNKVLRSNRNKKTENYEGMKYSKELIRQLSDPEYAKEEERYAREAQKHKRAKSQSARGSAKSAKSAKSVKSNSAASKSKQKKKKKYRFRPGKLIRNLFVLFMVFLVAFTGLFYALTGNFDKVETEKSAFAIDPQVEDDLSGYRNIAILGVDSRADEGYDGSRTDAIIIMSIKKSTGEIKLISVMRDSYLRMEYMDGTPILDKITHAHHYSGGVNTCASLNQSLDLNIDEFVIFNWNAVADAVDCLGGITVNVKDNEINDMNHWGPDTAENVGRDYHEITETGKQTLDGVQATTYCRIRKTSGGDAGRSRRYKAVVAGVMKKALTRPWKLKELSDTVFPNIRTNMSQTQMYTAVIQAPRYHFGKSVSWPNEYWADLLQGISYVVPMTLESNVKWLHKRVFGQEDYQLSDTCQQINQDISYDTGLY